MVNGYGTIYWSIDNLPVATPIRNNDSSSLRSHQLPTGPQLWVGPYEPLPIYAGLLIGLTFCESFASTHSATIMSCREDSISQHTSLSSDSYALPSPFITMFIGLWGVAFYKYAIEV